MLPILRKQLKFVDREFSNLALMLTQDNENPTYRRELLDESKLDFSMESLHHIDSYLEALNQDPPENHDFMRVALRCGAYIGEVMRKRLPGTWHWISHDEAAKHSKMVAGFERTIATVGILWKNNKAISFPLGKVCKFIENGSEDSVHFFAETLIRNEQQK